jgi:hypothetical protein
MDTRITTETFRTPQGATEKLFVLWEISRPGITEPWIAIADSVNRKELVRYKNFLSKG